MAPRSAAVVVVAVVGACSSGARSRSRGELRGDKVSPHEAKDGSPAAPAPAPSPPAATAPEPPPPPATAAVTTAPATQHACGDPDEAARVWSGAQRRLLRCGQTAGSTCVVIAWTVGEDGRVASAEARGITDRAAKRCMESLVKAWTFAACPGGEMRTYEHPINCGDP